MVKGGNSTGGRVQWLSLMSPFTRDSSLGSSLLGHTGNVEVLK